MSKRQKTAVEGPWETANGSHLRVVESDGGGEQTPQPTRRSGANIRAKILSLVVLSALVPAALVGVISYFTARNLQRAELSEQLAERVEAIRGQMDRFFDERLADSDIFASSFVVSESLDAWLQANQRGDAQAAQEAASRIRAYLSEVRDRYPLYRELAVFDASGALITGVGPAHDPKASTHLAELDSKTPQAYLGSVGDRHLSYVVHEVQGRDSKAIGHLRAVSAFDELWQDLANGQAQARGRVRVLGPELITLFDSDLYPESSAQSVDSEGANLSLSGATGIADYDDENGREVVGAFQSHPAHEVGLLVELDSTEAFAVSRRLRAFALLTSVLAAGVIAALGFWVVVGLTKPIAALISGANAAAQGNLGIQVPVSSTDEIGDLTDVFNHMVRSLKESRAKLQTLSTTDELTGLNNRRHLAKMFDIELGRTARTGRPLSVLMIDLDHFKSFNDRLGHLEGDRFLRRVGDFLTAQIRPTDVLARYGGEEFIVLLPDTNNEGALQLAERLRAEFVEETSIGGGGPEVTISVGVATTRREEQTRDQIVAAADAALYAAKREGRNRVRVAV